MKLAWTDDNPGGWVRGGEGLGGGGGIYLMPDALYCHRRNDSLY